MVEFELTPGIAYYIGENIETENHRHHALEFIFAADAPFDLILAEQELLSLHGVIIDSNHPHQFLGRGGQYLFIYLEPELAATRKVSNHYNLAAHKVQQLASLPAFPKATTVVDLSFFTHTLGIDLTSTAGPGLDNRIREVLALIKDNIAHRQISADELAAGIFLSTSRFLHLFKEQMGVPVRKYILWCRIRNALMALLAGKNLTQSAHIAGFSDSAHFSRTFSEMFGVSPSSVLKR